MNFFAFRTRLITFIIKHTICYAVVNLLLLNDSWVAIQKTLSLIDSLNIIPLSKNKVKRFFSIFQTFFIFFYFFYFWPFFYGLYSQFFPLRVYILYVARRNIVILERRNNVALEQNTNCDRRKNIISPRLLISVGIIPCRRNFLQRREKSKPLPYE